MSTAPDISRILANLNGIHDAMAASHPALVRGQVWCKECGHTEKVDSADCLRHGWPKHCGYTMSLDPPTPADGGEG